MRPENFFLSSTVDLESLSVLCDLEKKIPLAPKVEHTIMSFETIEIKMAAVSPKRSINK